MSIQQVAEKLSLSADTIRRWERLGMIPLIPRDHNGRRTFTETDIRWVKHAKLLNQMNVSPDFQIEYVKLSMLGEKAAPARQSLLQEQFGQLKADHQCLIEQINAMEKLVESEEPA
ncbi:MerR family transcriptional regulator [Limosilactobacillus albertensis]|uniref:MerR family transcriptional regulator n=1 Tax=Limosilactobacillus albertensis TaxID=2759752 RepID=A0A839H2P5_9LACO|nr:MerR family transcriptional regulator [Limosilactobacillus albertensis]MBB1124171.1 MerR family transcriptional regulator [Limosilactobacillus albertensis]MCD7122039.1 MerR family transcriptional regulator [Limosilactobacillus albertensis]